MTTLHFKNNVKAKGRFRIKTYKAGTKELLRQTGWMDNLIMTNEGNGINLIARHLVGSTEISLEITQAKIGTGSTAPTNNDVDLETPVVSGIQVANRSANTTGQVILEFFIPDAELPEGTYYEFGIFCSAKLFARSLIDPAYTKSVGEDTSVEYTLTFSNT